MTLPEYDENCNCDLCVMIRNERNARMRRLVKKEIDLALREHSSPPQISTGTHLMEDYFR